MPHYAPQPGTAIAHYTKRQFTTLGAYVLTDEGIRWLVSAHGNTYLPNGELRRPGDATVSLEPPKEETRWDLTRRFKRNGKEFRIQRVNLRSFRIKGFDYLPAVLKQPREPQVGESVVKSGAKTSITKGTILETDAKATFAHTGWGGAGFREMIRTSRMAAPGDSGAVLLSENGLEPLGQLIAVNKSSAFFGKMTSAVSILDIRGVFCPVSLPVPCPPLLLRIAQGLIWDGCWKQTRDLSKEDPLEILRLLGVAVQNLPDPAHDTGEVNIPRLLCPSEGQPVLQKRTRHIVGVVTIERGDFMSVTRFDYLCQAFGLEPLPTIHAIT